MNIYHDTGSDAEAVLQDSDATGRRRMNFKTVKVLHFFSSSVFWFIVAAYFCLFVAYQCCCMFLCLIINLVAV